MYGRHGATQVAREVLCARVPLGQPQGLEQVLGISGGGLLGTALSGPACAQHLALGLHRAFERARRGEDEREELVVVKN